MRRLNLIDQHANESEGNTDEDAEKVVLHINGDGAPPIVLKGKIKSQQFSTMIDSGSPITIFIQTPQIRCETCRTSTEKGGIT